MNVFFHVAHRFQSRKALKKYSILQHKQTINSVKYNYRAVNKETGAISSLVKSRRRLTKPPWGIIRTDEAHHFDVSRNRGWSGKLRVGMHASHRIGHTAGYGACGHVVRMQRPAGEAAGCHGDKIFACKYPKRVFTSRNNEEALPNSTKSMRTNWDKN